MIIIAAALHPILLTHSRATLCCPIRSVRHSAPSGVRPRESTLSSPSFRARQSTPCCRVGLLTTCSIDPCPHRGSPHLPRPAFLCYLAKNISPARSKVDSKLMIVVHDWAWTSILTSIYSVAGRSVSVQQGHAVKCIPHFDRLPKPDAP